MVLQLDVLACNSSFSGTKLTGEVRINGKPRNRTTFQRLSCYVQQKDVLMASATVSKLSTPQQHPWHLAWNLAGTNTYRLQATVRCTQKQVVCSPCMGSFAPLQYFLFSNYRFLM